MRACNIKIEHLDNPIGIDVLRPYISWTCEGGIKQTAYEIKAFDLCAEGSIKKEIWHSGKVFTNDMHARLDVDLHSRERVELSIILFDEEDRPQESSSAFFEMGFLEKKDWSAKWINPEKENLLEVNKKVISNH